MSMRFSFGYGRERITGGLEDAVRRALLRVPHPTESEASEIRIQVYGGEVILAGIVSTNEARDRMLRVASEVSGVLHVRNKLRTDNELMQALRDRLRSNPITAVAAIEPVVFRGVVELRGSAPYDAQIAAIKMARGTDGVRDVVNALQLLAPAAAALRADGT